MWPHRSTTSAIDIQNVHDAGLAVIHKFGKISYSTGIKSARPFRSMRSKQDALNCITMGMAHITILNIKN